MINNKRVYAITPARGGSKGIPKKNLIDFNGSPLIAHSILYAQSSNFIDHIIVSTDCIDIENVAKKFDSKVIKRPDNISKDDSSTELAIEHVIMLERIDSAAIIVLLQPTSPIRPKEALDRMLQNFIDKEYDSMISISPCHPLNWKLDSNELICQYDYNNRPMRQEFKIDDYLYDENGSVYIFTQKLFMEKKNRLGGKIGYEIFPEEFGRQVDTYLDLEVLKATANYINMKGQDE